MHSQTVNETLKRLRVVTLYPSPESSEREDYLSAYTTWRDVWSETFRELDSLERLFSDDFSRQDEVICLFEGNQCLASGSLRWVDMSLATAREDSYFKMWPKEAIEGLCQKGSKIIICSSLTVHPRARGGKLGLPIKDVISGLILKRLLTAGVDAMTGTMRADRGMHKTTYRFGATVLVPNLVHHNAPVDLVAFFPKNIRFDEDPLIYSAVEYLWNFKRHGNRTLNRKAA